MYYKCPLCTFGNYSDYYVRVHIAALHKKVDNVAPLAVKSKKSKKGGVCELVDINKAQGYAGY